ncbi:hypothetical protein BH24PSE2_BH24PSE2_15820 [soil metagenome]
MSEPFRTISTPPGDRTDFEVRFEEISPGRYAVSILQDLNGSGALERGFLG